jgi:hypothetical protein
MFKHLTALQSLCKLSIVGTGLAPPGSASAICLAEVRHVAQNMAALPLQEVRLSQGECVSEALAEELATKAAASSVRCSVRAVAHST